MGREDVQIKKLLDNWKFLTREEQISSIVKNCKKCKNPFFKSLLIKNKTTYIKLRLIIMRQKLENLQMYKKKVLKYYKF